MDLLHNLSLGFGVARAFAWKDIEIVGRPKPSVRLSGRVAAWADRVGTGYITRAGFRGDAIVTLIEKLRRQTRLEEQLMGTPESRDPSALSTHPCADDRLAALANLPDTRKSGDSEQ